MDNQKTLQELWVLPRNMKTLPYKFHGRALYSSDKLKLKFFEAMLKTDWGKYHAKNFQRLIKQNYIVPTLMVHGIRNFLKRKFKSEDKIEGRDWTKDVQGVYSSEHEKVFVFIDNESSWYGHASNKILVKTTLHETMHLSAAKNNAGFLRVMKPTLEKFYEEYYKDIFSCRKVDVTKIIQAMHKGEGRFSKNLHNNFMKAVVDATQNETKLDEATYEEIMRDLYFITGYFPWSPELLARYYPRYYHMFGPINRAYRKTFGEKNVYTSPAQELWALSEVAAVMVELLPTDRRVANLLSNIK